MFPFIPPVDAAIFTGWHLELHLRASLAVDALKMAISNAISARTPIAGSLIRHLDRECNALAAAILTSSTRLGSSRV
jgi:hypothetical protein